MRLLSTKMSIESLAQHIGIARERLSLLLLDRQFKPWLMSLSDDERREAERAVEQFGDGHCDFSQRTVDAMQRDVMPAFENALRSQAQQFRSIADDSVRELLLTRFVTRFAFSALGGDAKNVWPFFLFCFD